MQETPSHSKYESAIANALDIIQSAIYLLVSLFLVVMALMTFYIVGRDLSMFVFGPANIDSIAFALSDLLIILIITGLIQTVLVFMQRHQLDTRVILAVGLTAMIRRILVFGAEKASWVDTALTALIIFVLILGIFLIGDKGITQSKQ